MIELNGVRDALAALNPREQHFYLAPGRLTLLGDRAEAGDGFSLSIAIDRATVAAVAPREDRTIRVISLDRAETATFSLDALGESAATAWSSVIRAVAAALDQHGGILHGSDVAVRTTIPEDAGLGAVAALGVATGFAIAGGSETTVAPAEVIAACREATDGVAPVAVAAGRRAHAVLVDARSSEANAIPFALDGTAIVVCDSFARHDRAAIDIVRREECVAAAAILREVLPKTRTLRDVSLADFLRHGERLPETLYRRARHVVTENVRVLQAVAAIRSGDADAVGGRMNESHDSLRDDFDVSSPELDALVSAARSVRGVYGSRMAGRTAGGATVSLVERAALGAFRSTVGAVYRGAFGRDPAIIEVRASDGAAQIR